MTPYDEMPIEVRRDRLIEEMRKPFPIEVRRANFGWFGPPWPSGVCYDEDDRLIEEMRKPFPVGESCLYCTEPFDEADGDSGQAMPFGRADGSMTVTHVHKECMLREVAGSVACLEGHHRHDTGQTRRQEALAVWAWMQEHGETWRRVLRDRQQPHQVRHRPRGEPRSEEPVPAGHGDDPPRDRRGGD